MRVMQSLNQNALLVEEGKKQFVVLGKGIGFGKKKGEIISEVQGLRYYEITENNPKNILESISEKNLEIAEEIAEVTAKKFKTVISAESIVSLASHLEFIHDRHQEEATFQEPFAYELKYLYAEEYNLAKWTIDYINKNYHLSLPLAEVSFFTLHFVNMQLDKNSSTNLLKLSTILTDLINVVEEKWGKKIDKESIDFSRFIVHLRYFIMRNFSAVRKEEQQATIDDFYSLAEVMYVDEMETLSCINKELSNKHDICLSKPENFYLLLHLIRLKNC